MSLVDLKDELSEEDLFRIDDLSSKQQRVLVHVLSLGDYQTIANHTPYPTMAKKLANQGIFLVEENRKLKLTKLGIKAANIIKEQLRHPTKDISFPPIPWKIESNSFNNFYVSDGNGKKIFTLLGSILQKTIIGELIVALSGKDSNIAENIDFPFPWKVQYVGVFGYIVDANNTRIVTILGSNEKIDIIGKWIEKITSRE